MVTRIGRRSPDVYIDARTIARVVKNARLEVLGT
jgi:hypothetical protein